MADDQLSVSSDGLGSAAEGLDDLHLRMVSLSSGLQSRLAAFGQPWGDDKNGQAFYQQYGPAKDNLIEGVQGLATVTGQAADGLRTMQKGFSQTEDTAVESARRVAMQPVPPPMSSPGGGTLMARTAEEPALPQSTLRQGTVHDETVQPSQMMDAERLPEEPAQPRQTDVARSPEEPATPTARIDDEPVQQTPVHPLLPLAPRVDGVPAQQTPAQPVFPREQSQFVAEEPAVPGAPRLGEEPLQPTESLQPELPAQADQEVPVTADRDS